MTSARDRIVAEFTAIDPHAELRADPREFVAGRWWPFAEITNADPARLDPNLPRFIDKLAREERKRLGQGARPRFV